MTVGYYDPARDFQTATQAARRGAAGRRTTTIELPAAVDAGAARAIAEARLAREWAGRTAATVTLPRRRIDLVPGMIATLPGQAGRWRVTRRTIEAAAVTVELVRLPGDGPVRLPATPGRAVAEADARAGATRIALLDLPWAAAGTGDTPTLLVAAAGTAPGWRRAALLGSLDGGAGWETIGTTAAPATMGTAATVLPRGSATIVDGEAVVEVDLLHDGMTLAGDDRLGWSDEANLAVIGDEIVQFGRVEQIGPARWRIGRLLRGRRGTEWAIAGHRAGERFVLIEADALTPWAVPLAVIGTELAVAATGIGDAAPARATIGFAARALRPPAPVALDIADGMLRWTRRSRSDRAWRDGGDVAVGEEVERYRVVLADDDGEHVVETAVAAIALPPGTRAATVAQIGTYAASDPGAHIEIGGPA